MSRIIFGRYRDRYVDIANKLLNGKYRSRLYSKPSNDPTTPSSPLQSFVQMRRNKVSIFIPLNWTRSIQTEPQPTSNMSPFKPTKGDISKNLAQTPLLPGKETFKDQNPKLVDTKRMHTTTTIPVVSDDKGKGVTKKETSKPNLWTRVKNETLHYYHGFKLFFYEVRISSKLFVKILKGHTLTRRERRQFERTVADIFRLVPFSIFLIVPFMEFLLPVAVKIFPGLLPSTFQTIKTKEQKRRAELKIKLEMSKFLRKTIAELSDESHEREGPTIQEFVEFFEAIRERGEDANVDEVIRFSQLFRDEYTLDNMTHGQLQALCKLLMLNSVGTNALLRLQLNMCLRRLKADDILIENEGIDNMTVSELQSACQARGMRAVGISEKKLKGQLMLWLNLHLEKQVPPSLLLLTQALTLKSQVPNPEGLGKTLSALPEELIDHLEAEVAKTPKSKLESLRNEQAKIEEEKVEGETEDKEKLEKQQASAKPEEKVPQDIMKDIPAVETILKATSVDSDSSLTKEDVKTLSEAVDKLEDMRESIADIKTEMAQSEEHPKEQLMEGAEVVETQTVSKAEKRLAKKVNSIIGKLEDQINQLESTALASEHISTTDLTDTLLALKVSLSPAKIEKVVKAIDTDSDGFILKENLQKIFELIASEETDISTEHVKQITELIHREDLSVKIAGSDDHV